MASSHGRSHRSYRQARQRLKETAPWLCWRCGDPIPPWPFPHPQSWSADHVVPLAEGGDANDIANLRPAHLACNSRGGADQTNGKARQPKTSREW